MSDELRYRIERVIQERKDRHKAKPKMSLLSFSGWMIAIELIAGIIVGMGAGYMLDRKADLFPLFFCIGTILGFAAGLLNIYRSKTSGS